MTVTKGVYKLVYVDTNIQPIAGRVAQNLEILSKSLSTNQSSACGVYDQYHVINGKNDKSHENPGTPGTKLKVFRNNLKILCHPICNRRFVHRYECGYFKCKKLAWVNSKI